MNPIQQFTTSQIKKTRRNWLQNKQQQMHLRDDIGCGLSMCPFHTSQMKIRSDSVLIVDTRTLLKHTDIISRLTQVVILQSSLQQLPSTKYCLFNNHFIFADLYHRTVQGNLAQSLIYYEQHSKDIGLQLKSIAVLSDTQTQQTVPRCIPLHQYIKSIDSNLLDLMGFDISQQMKDLPQIHPEHLKIDQAMKLVKRGELFLGKYMKDRSTVKVGNQRYKIILDNNRAIFGDAVVVQLYSKEKWGKTIVKVPQQDMNQIKNEPEIEQDIECIREQYKCLPINVVLSGKIMAIQRSAMRNCCGTLCPTPFFLTAQYSIHEFIPADSAKYPSFYMRTYNPQPLLNQRIMVAFDSWPSTSEYPLCHYLRTIGPVGDSLTEANVILLEHDVEISDFSVAAYACLPTSNLLQNADIAQRRDLRAVDVVSIDPPGCRDIDDALHCLLLPNGNYQVGVHIADVSHFVKPDSALDLEARNRCTTVYLIDKRTDMLPKLLTEDLCSLRSDVDRLCFSVVWQIDKMSNIVSTWYGKTVIHSRKAFTYMQAQQLMESKSTSNIAESIRNLNGISKALKQKRRQKGALTLASTQVKITLDNNSATDVQLYETIETNHLIEEFMLLANISVAEKIFETFPSLSILRRHAPPKYQDLESLRQLLHPYQLKFTSNRQLADSLDKINDPKDPFFNRLVRMLTTRCMNEATYFCSADHSHFDHYGLAVSKYTHFTSPIRRYTQQDQGMLTYTQICRHISASTARKRIGVGSFALFYEYHVCYEVNKMKMAAVCDTMNRRNRMARYASRASADFHTYQYFKDKHNNHKAIVLAEPQYSHTDNSPQSQNQVKLLLVQYGLQVKATTLRPLKLFQYVSVKINVQMRGFKKIIDVQIL